MMKTGYARESPVDQDFEFQQQRFKAEGCKIIRSEKISGASRDGRHELANVIEFWREGDELVVTRLDRLGRDTRAVLNCPTTSKQLTSHFGAFLPSIS